MDNETRFLLKLTLICALAGLAFGLWQNSVFAGVFAGILTMAVWRRD